MRILLNLLALKDCDYDLKYFHKLQGFIYSLIKETPYKVLHDKKCYKLFCFSNIFPIGDIKMNEKRNLLISSPDNALIRLFKEKLMELKEDDKPINIGEMSFAIEDISLIKPNLNKKSLTLISATPIIIRIPRKNFKKYGINNEKVKNKAYVYWRPEYSFEAFVKQLEENLIKKYNDFYKTNLKIDSLFEIFKFIKPTVNHVIINGKEQMIVGSVWKFSFSYLSRIQKKLLSFGIDAGFGERNSLGFGFINVVKSITT